MTRILITGAAGFLGRRLTRALIQTGSAAVIDGPDPTVTELCLADCVAFEPPSAPGVAVTVRNGDLNPASSKPVVPIFQELPESEDLNRNLENWTRFS